MKVRFIGGRVRLIRFFASRLKYSRWPEVTLVPNQQVEALARTLVGHFAAMGGVPLAAAPVTSRNSSRSSGRRQ